MGSKNKGCGDKAVDSRGLLWGVLCVGKGVSFSDNCSEEWLWYKDSR